MSFVPKKPCEFVLPETCAGKTIQGDKQGRKKTNLEATLSMRVDNFNKVEWLEQNLRDCQLVTRLGLHSSANAQHRILRSRAEAQPQPHLEFT